ncbi:MAG: hypothetical protein DWQ10_14655 [Calditrichaeota bacterium]|nr:MAG: hypothetical protein DWQ10_14655 [Calditrichota bacterium]
MIASLIELFYYGETLSGIHGHGKNMVLIKITRKLPVIAVAVLLLQSIGLLYCGDSDCLRGDSDEFCQTLVCSVLDSHDQSKQPSDFDQEDFCQCIYSHSHNIPEITFFSAIVVNSYFFMDAPLHITPPTNRIDHIPRA